MLPAQPALQHLPGLLGLSVGRAAMGTQTTHAVPSIATEQQVWLLGLQGEKCPGLGGASCTPSIPGAAAPQGRILPKTGCSRSWGQQTAALGGFWLVQRQLYNHKTVCCCLSVSAG